MIDLSEVTFIVPVKIDSYDRAFNFEYIIAYLCRNFKTNIIITESDTDQKAGIILRRIPRRETNIQYHFEQKNSSVFHRTRLLNEMLWDVKTPITCNLDCDVFLELSTYVKAKDAIINEGYDMVYPYFFGMSQKMVFRPRIKDDLTQEIKHVLNQSQYGHIQFIKTDVYKEIGGEIEDYVSWAPEDQCRFYVADSLGKKIKWLDDCFVYHLEHVRGPNSSQENPFFDKNIKLFEHIKTLSVDELRNKVANADYIKKYQHKQVYFLTYSDKNYRVRQEQLIDHAKELGVADHYIGYTREQLVETQFYKDNKTILDLPRGNGYWAWKPAIILWELEKTPPHSIVVYLDCGDWINNDFNQFLQRKMRNCDILLTEGGFPNKQYTKRDCFIMMGADNDAYYDDIQVEAGIIVVKNTPAAINLLKEWLKWCMVPEVVTDMPNKHGQNLPEFMDHRHDQSILSIMKLYYDIPCTQEMRQFIECNVNK